MQQKNQVLMDSASPSESNYTFKSLERHYTVIPWLSMYMYTCILGIENNCMIKK